MSNSTVALLDSPTPALDRKLATIRKISDVNDIVFMNADGNPETAENIVCVTIDGWKCVAKRGEFKVGDLCIYFEIDSMLDSENPVFAFMEKSKWRVRTVKLKGQISQGLAMPLSILENPNYTVIYPQGNSYGLVYFYKISNGATAMMMPTPDAYIKEGEDFTEYLRVTKYEPVIPENLRGKVKGNFPGFIIKTDEERVQNLKQYFEQYKDNLFDVTEKLDGSSFTCYWKNDIGAFGVCSRNLELTETEDNAFWQVARRLNLEQILSSENKSLCIQGEMVGQGIQGNKYNLPNKELFVFNVYDIEKATYFSHAACMEFCKKHGLNMVPEIYQKVAMPSNMDQILEMSDGVSVLNPSTMREGLVWRTMVRGINGEFERVSFKVISNKFLLKHGE